jgi:hypothetical protein
MPLTHSPRYRRPVAALALALACAALTGCGPDNVVAVSGTLTYKGKPVTNAYIHFVPDNNGRPSMGETDANGRFTLTYDPQTKGAQIGKHKVFVMHNVAADANLPEAVPGVAPKMSADMGELFSKYGGEKSTVTVTIDKAVSDLKLDWD